MSKSINRWKPQRGQRHTEPSHSQKRRAFLQAALLATAAGAGFPGLSLPGASAAQTSATRDNRHTLIVLNPGHFHAGLTLRNSHPRINDDVFVYAPDGPDVDNFLRMVASFNERAENPTRWNLKVQRGADSMQRLLADRAGDVVIISGRNDIKMESINRLHSEGFFVLGDKPWLTGVNDLGMLRATTAQPPLAMDIMTERHQIATQLQQRLIGDTAVFGQFRSGGDDPALLFKSIHHLYKIVNKRPLIRPQWFFDTTVQGDGMMDVTTHLVDLAQWFISDGELLDYAHDIQLLSARQWPTEVPLEIFSRITGLDHFPEAIKEHAQGDTLHYLCNAGIDYRLRGIPVRIESLWNLRIPEGGGDTHYAVARGTRATLVVDQGPETDYETRLSVHSADKAPINERPLARAIESLQNFFPGVGYQRDGAILRITIPDSIRTGHESHFATVLNQFIDYIDSSVWPSTLGSDLVVKYTLLARARELALRGGRV